MLHHVIKRVVIARNDTVHFADSGRGDVVGGPERLAQVVAPVKLGKTIHKQNHRGGFRLWRKTPRHH